MQSVSEGMTRPCTPFVLIRSGSLCVVLLRGERYLQRPFLPEVVLHDKLYSVGIFAERLVVEREELLLRVACIQLGQARDSAKLLRPQPSPSICT